MTPLRRVGLLWVLILAIFAGFNIAYWPVWRHQQRHDPKNFMTLAEAHREAGELARAIAVLEQGIAGFRPPKAQPYVQLRGYLREQGRAEDARALEPIIVFYHGTGRTAPEDRAEHWAQAVDLYLERSPAPLTAPLTAETLARLAGRLAAIYGIEEAVLAWESERHYALLQLLDGGIAPRRAIGETGVDSPVDILVQSGGGEGLRRTAHLFIGNRDFAGVGRGFHAALVDPESGQALQWGVFDLWDEIEEAHRMQRFLESAAPGVIGVFAVLDEGSVNMTPGLEAALIDFGLYPEARINREKRLLGMRYSFAAIGVKGAAPGSALQVWSPGEFAGHPGRPVNCGVLHDRRGG